MSEGTNWSIQCINGHDIEGETPDTPIEDRRPCPECGTTDRSISATATPDTIRVTARLPQAHVTVTHTASAVLVDIETITDTVRHLYWTPPSGPDATWTFRIEDGDHNLLEMCEADRPLEAILKMRDAIRPDEP